ncbi:putative endoglucanase type K, partial [Pseudolycoriella hygida]
MKVFLLAIFLVGASAQQNGKSTRYWDCCKPSCGWPGKPPFTAPVRTCAKNGVNVVDSNTPTSYTCNNNQPWAVNSTLSYGFAAANILGQSEWTWCCACYQLTFTSGPVVGKKMIVQVTNTGGDLG